MEKCKVCGKEFKVMTVMHLRTHDMTMKEYKNFKGVVKKELKEIDVTSNSEVTPKELKKRIWGDQEGIFEKPLKEFLQEYDITAKELINIVKKFKRGEHIDVNTEIANREKIALSSVEKFSDKDRVETTSLHEAEALEKHHGFTCIDVKSKPVKTWVLVKN